MALWNIIVERSSQETRKSSSEAFAFNLKETSGTGRVGGFSRSMDKKWGLVWLDDGCDTLKPRGFDLHSFTGSRTTYVFKGLTASLLHVQRRTNLVVNALAFMREGGLIDILDVDTVRICLRERCVVIGLGQISPPHVLTCLLFQFFVPVISQEPMR